MKIIGLTGGIATGKSTAEKFFEELGCYVIDADDVVHKLYSRNDIKERLKRIFKEDIFDLEGNVDRKKLAQIIFSDKSKKKLLEDFIHPEVNRFINRQIERIKSKDPSSIVIVSVPLMIETGSYERYDKVIVVYAPKELQIKRLLLKNYTYQEALTRIDAQMDIEEKIKYADYVINNTKTLEDLRMEVEDVYKKIKSDC